MKRGKAIFVCNDCKKVFIGDDLEYHATILSHPLECPKCGSMHTKPIFASKDIYKKIWRVNNEKL
ncbi:MAG: hypothetical protein U0L08_04555 [Bacteroidales bacterium]|nr:hypothetical protein [Bacteroidales bacterium]